MEYLNKYCLFDVKNKLFLKVISPYGYSKNGQVYRYIFTDSIKEALMHDTKTGLDKILERISIGDDLYSFHPKDTSASDIKLQRVKISYELA